MISEKNAPRYLIIAHACKDCLFLIPVFMLFYNTKGVDIGDFFLIQGIFLLAVFFLEIPTGYIADLFSRKKTLIVGFMFAILGYVLLVTQYGFWWVLTAELCFAMTAALVSGSAEAYLYDLLKKNNKQKSFHQKLSKFSAVSDFGLTIATFSGAFIYQFIGPNYPAYLSIVVILTGLIIVVFLPDVPESKRIVEEGKSKWQDIVDISKASVKHEQIKWLMFYPAVYGTLTLILMWGLQTVMEETHIPVFVFSLVVGTNAFMRTGWSIVSGKLLEKLSLSGVIKIMFWVMLVACVGSVAAVYVPSWAVYICLGMMMLGSSSIVIASIVTSTLIHNRIKSDERATVLSVKSMVSRIVLGIGMVSLKPLFDNIGVGETFAVTSLLLLPILYLTLKLTKMNLKTYEE